MTARYLFITIFSLLCYEENIAQYAKVLDKDGYVNVRKTANTNGDIIGKIKSDELVYIFNKGNEQGDWLIVDYKDESNNLLTGYIHKSRLKPINTYELIPSATDSENEATFILRDIRVNITTEKFDYKANEKYITTHQYPSYAVQKYKGQEMWGLDGTNPQSHYKSITINIETQQIDIPEKETENLFNPNIDMTACYLDDKTETLYITATNADGAGAYDVLFVIEKGKYKERRMYDAD